MDNSSEIDSPKKVLSVFSLVMINVIAVDSVRTIPMAASYGFGLITAQYHLLKSMHKF